MIGLREMKIARERRRARQDDDMDRPAHVDADVLVSELRKIHEVLERHHNSTPRPLVS